MYSVLCYISHPVCYCASSAPKSDLFRLMCNAVFMRLCMWCFLCVVYFLRWDFCVCDVCSLGTMLFAGCALCVFLRGVLCDGCVCGWSCVVCL